MDLREKLTAAQREAVTHLDGPLLVIAGPGSGKTRVITCRIAALEDSGVNPFNICAITFTNKAAEEMRVRAESIRGRSGAVISTFHSLCARILREFCTEADLPSSFSIYDETDQVSCMKQAIGDCGLDKSNFPPSRMLGAVGKLKNRLEEPVSDGKGRSGFFDNVLAGVYKRYQQILRARGALDFDDLLLETALLLKNNEQVRLRLAERWRFLLIDEFQDTNIAQYHIARQLVVTHGNICATGDPDQSIYGWRGADIGNIMAFTEDFQGARVVKLEHNFRSTPQILLAAENLISSNTVRRKKRLLPTRDHGDEISVCAFKDEKAEAEAVACAIASMKEAGRLLGEIAVFYRVNSYSRAIEEALVRLGIPYTIVRGVEFYRRKEVRDVLAYLRVLANGRDEAALVRACGAPPRGIGKTTIERLKSYAAARGITLLEAMRKADENTSIRPAARRRLADFVKMIDKLGSFTTGPVETLMREVLDNSGLMELFEKDGLEGGEAAEYIDELTGAAAEYDQRTPEGSLIDYLGQISLASDTETLHSAKGLEFDSVFITGAEDGLIPHQRALDDERYSELEEERRLLFVGITRARVNLHISYAFYRWVRGHYIRTTPSRFLHELGVAEPEEFFPDEQMEVYHPESGPVLQKGQRVRHDRFGTGRVVEFVDMGEESIVRVMFQTGRLKTLMVKYAGLNSL
jgi:DNA helicase-2/ATP-dependent DNA helicase PcrA